MYVHEGYDHDKYPTAITYDIVFQRGCLIFM